MSVALEGMRMAHLEAQGEGDARPAQARELVRRWRDVHPGEDAVAGYTFVECPGFSYFSEDVVLVVWRSLNARSSVPWTQMYLTRWIETIRFENMPPDPPTVVVGYLDGGGYLRFRPHPLSLLVPYEIPEEKRP